MPILPIVDYADFWWGRGGVQLSNYADYSGEY